MVRRVAVLVAVEANDQFTDEHVARSTAAVLRWAIADGQLPVITGVSWAEPLALRPGYEVKESVAGADTPGHDAPTADTH